MQCQNSANDILIYRSSKCEIDLVGNARAAPGWIVPFHLDHDTNDVRIRPLWSRLSPPLWRKQQPILSLDQCTMEIQQSRRFERNRCTNQACRPDEQRTES